MDAISPRTRSNAISSPQGISQRPTVEQATSTESTERERAVTQVAQEKINPLKAAFTKISVQVKALHSAFEAKFLPEKAAEKAAMKESMKSLLNGATPKGAKELETEKVGDAYYSKVAIKDFAKRSGLLTGDISIVEPKVVSSTQPSKAVKETDKFPATVFSQCQGALEKTKKFKDPLSATNAILSAASQTQAHSLDIFTKYAQENNGDFPLVKQTVNEVHIRGKSVIIHSRYTIEPTQDTQGNMIQLRRDEKGALIKPGEPGYISEEQQRKDVCKKDPSKAWVMDTTIEIPIEEFNKKENVYGSETCDIQFALDVDIQKGPNLLQTVGQIFQRTPPLPLSAFPS